MENEEIIDVEIEEPTVVLPIVDDNVLTPRMFTQIMLRSDKWALSLSGFSFMPVTT